jgi:hypothetical protein
MPHQDGEDAEIGGEAEPADGEEAKGPWQPFGQQTERISAPRCAQIDIPNTHT